MLGCLRTATGVGRDLVTVTDGAFGEGGGCAVATSSLNVTCIMVLSLCHVDRAMCLEIWILEITVHTVLIGKNGCCAIGATPMQELYLISLMFALGL